MLVCQNTEVTSKGNTFGTDQGCQTGRGEKNNPVVDIELFIKPHIPIMSI